LLLRGAASALVIVRAARRSPLLDGHLGRRESASMNAYGWLKLLHIVAAITAVGTNVTYFVWLRRIRSAAGEGVFVLEGLQELDRKLANPAYVVLPVTGVAMVLVGGLGFSTFWIVAAIVLYVAMGVFAGVFFGPALRRQVELARTQSTTSGAYARAMRRTTITGAATMALIALIVYLMVLKPG
jgi:uncharacterized membrane protein